MRALLVPADPALPVRTVRFPALLAERRVWRLIGRSLDTVDIGRDRGADLCLVSGAGPVNVRASRLSPRPVHGDAAVVAVVHGTWEGDRLVTVSREALSFLSDSLRSPDLVHDGVSMSL